MTGDSPNIQRVSGFLEDHRLFVLIGIQFLAGAVATPVLAFLPIYIEEILELDQDFTANARAIWLGTMGLFAVAGGALSDAVGRKSTIVLGLTGALAGAAIFVTDSPIAGTAAGSVLIGLAADSLLGLFLAGTLAAAFAWALSGQMTPLAKEFARPGESGRAIGLVNAPWSIAALGGAQIGGRMVADRPSEAFYVFAALAIAALLCATLLFRRVEHPRLEASA